MMVFAISDEQAKCLCRVFSKKFVKDLKIYDIQNFI